MTPISVQRNSERNAPRKKAHSFLLSIKKQQSINLLFSFRMQRFLDNVLAVTKEYAHFLSPLFFIIFVIWNQILESKCFFALARWIYMLIMQVGEDVYLWIVEQYCESDKWCVSSCVDTATWESHYTCRYSRLGAQANSSWNMLSTLDG